MTDKLPLHFILMDTENKKRYCEFDYNVHMARKLHKQDVNMNINNKAILDQTYCERNSCTIQLKSRGQGRPVLRVKKFTKDPNMINDYQKHMRETMKGLADDDTSPMEKMRIVAELWKEKKKCGPSDYI